MNTFEYNIIIFRAQTEFKNKTMTCLSFQSLEATPMPSLEDIATVELMRERVIRSGLCLYLPMRSAPAVSQTAARL
jgi:hypothetical protein